MRKDPGATCQNFLWISLSSTITETTHPSDWLKRGFGCSNSKFSGQACYTTDLPDRNNFGKPLILWVFCMPASDSPSVNLEGLVLAGIRSLEY